jgi:uncharacterized protein
MKYFLDTNIFLRFLVADNQKAHEACSTLFLLIEEKKVKVATSALVFAEIVWVLQSFYRFPKAEVHNALKAFTALPLSYEDKTNVSVAINLHASHAVKFVDALLASHPSLQNGKMTIVSYDKDFDSLRVRRIEPQDMAIV